MMGSLICCSYNYCRGWNSGLAYRIAGNFCGNYVLRFVVNNEVCRFNACGLLDTLCTDNNYNEGTKVHNPRR